MAGSKRERDLHRQKLARQQKEAAEAAEARRGRLRIAGVVAAVLAVVGIVGGVALANQGDDAPSATPAPSVPTASASKDPNASPAAVSCTKVNGKKPGTKQYTLGEVQQNKLIPNGTYTEAVTTNCGDMKFALDSKNAPVTTAAFTFLSDRAFFDNTLCHRLTTEGIYVIQCGDPLGDGTGGPGFELAEENLPKAGSGGTAVYKKGTIAMANAGTGTTGSQFFIVYKDSPLPPNYTVLGTVSEGLEIAEYVASKGTVDGSGDGAPKQPLQITKMVSSVSYPVAPGNS